MYSPGELQLVVSCIYQVPDPLHSYIHLENHGRSKERGFDHDLVENYKINNCVHLE